jgi:ankyrin repeat protein
MEDDLHHAIQKGKGDEVDEILKVYNLDINNKVGYYTPFHMACCTGCDRKVASLLAYPNVDVNAKNSIGNTPFNTICHKGTVACARLLLDDYRVDIYEPSNVGRTPFFKLVYQGHLEIIKHWIASGRVINLKERGRDRRMNIIEAARHFTGIYPTRREMSLKVLSLIERFKENEEKTRHEIKIELGWYHEKAAKHFSWIIFLCDGLLEIKEDDSKVSRFFKIARELPMDLQMVLCHRAIGSAFENIPADVREKGFMELAKLLLK